VYFCLRFAWVITAEFRNFFRFSVNIFCPLVDFEFDQYHSDKRNERLVGLKRLALIGFRTTWPQALIRDDFNSSPLGQHAKNSSFESTR